MTIDSPKSISIGCGAFADWDKLQTLKISGTEVCLGTHEYDVEVAPVFKGAPLSSLSIDCDKITLKDNVFEGHADLAELSFKAKYASLWGDVFKDCPKLSSLQFDCDTIYFGSTFTDNTDLTAITVNSHNIEFGYDSFKGCRNLKSLIFTADKEGDYVRISENAFSDCSGLTSVVLPSSVSGIGKSAFSGCTSLTSVKVEWQKPLQIYYYDNDYVVKKEMLLKIQAEKLVPYMFHEEQRKHIRQIVFGVSSVQSLSMILRALIRSQLPKMPRKSLAILLMASV